MNPINQTPSRQRPLLAIHLRLSFEDGSRTTMQMLAHSTAAAIDAAQQRFGDRLRGSSAQLLFAPGFEIPRQRQHPGTAANDERFAQAN